MKHVYLKPFGIDEIYGKTYIVRTRSLGASIVADEDAAYLRRIADSGLYTLEVTDEQEALFEKYRLVSETEFTRESIAAFDARRWRNYITGLTYGAIELMVSQECNMRCTYCYGASNFGGSGNMSRETAHAAIDLLKPEYAPVHDKCGERKLMPVKVAFFGGEPLMNYPLIADCVEYSEARFGKDGVKFSMTTNLTLVTEEMLEFLSAHNVSVMVSFDGPRKYQSANRRMRDGRDSYDATLEKIRLAQKYYKNLGGCATYYPEQDTALIKAEYARQGLHIDRLNPATGCIVENVVRHGSVARYPQESRNIEEYVKRLLKAVRARDADELRKLACNDASHAEIWWAVRNALPDNAVFGYCGSGTGMVCVDVKGDAYPCHCFVGLPEYLLGNIRGKTGLGPFAKSRLEVNPKCRDCYVKYNCEGICYYEAASDAPDEPDVPPVHRMPDAFCARKKRAFMLGVWLKESLCDADRAWIKSVADMLSSKAHENPQAKV